MRKIFITILLIPGLALAEVDLSQSLFSAFKSGCKSIGPLTMQATNHAYNLKTIIESVRNDDECKDWANNVEMLNSSILALRTPPGYENVDTISNKITDLMDMMAVETNATTKEELAVELAQLKVDSLYYGQNSDERLWANRIDRMDRTNYILNAFNTSVRGDTHCMNKYPGVFLELGGQVLQASGSSNMWGSAAGAGLMGMGAIINFIMDLIQDNKFGRALKKLNTTTLTTSYMCALETVSNTYCSAKETGSRIALAAESNISIFSSGWEGLAIMANMFGLNNWISRVISGTPSGNIATANLKKEVIELRSRYQKDVEEINALIREGESELHNSGPDGRDDILLQLIGSLVKKINLKEDQLRSSPYGNSFIKDPGCGPLFFIFSPDGERNPEVPQFTSCKTYIFDNLKLPTPSLDQIKDRMSTILEEGREYVNFRFSIVKETDPELVLLEGEKLAPFDRPSPIQTLRQIKNYLKNITETMADNILPHTGYTISQTIKKITDALEVLSHPTDEMEVPSLRIGKKAGLKLEQLQKLIAPDMKDNYLSERLRQIVILELKAKLRDGDFSESFEELLYLSIGDEISNLERFTSYNLQTGRYDVAGAMRSSMINLEVLGKVFKRNLYKMFKALEKDQERYPGETSTQITINRLCALTLSIPQIRDMKYIAKYCKGRKIEGVYSPKTVFLNFDDQYNKTFPERACGYFDYLRKNEVYQRFGRPSTRAAD